MKRKVLIHATYITFLTLVITANFVTSYPDRAVGSNVDKPLMFSHAEILDDTDIHAAADASINMSLCQNVYGKIYTKIKQGYELQQLSTCMYKNVMLYTVIMKKPHKLDNQKTW